MKKKLFDVILTVIGTFIMCVSVEMFIIPFNILSGGVAGLAVAVKPVLSTNLSATTISNIIAVSMLVVGAVCLGKQFFVTTVLSSVCYPVFTSYLAGVLVIPEIDPLLAAFYGGLVGGIGVGIVMRTGASTGGMDVPPLVIHKYTGIEVSKLVLVIDTLTVLLGLISYGLSAVLLGLICVFVMSYSLSKVLTFGEGSSAKSVMIISDHYEQIIKAISERLERGATLLDGRGSYSNAKKDVILVVVSKKQYVKLLEIIREYDESAFVITTDASDMHGEGFSFGFRI